MKVSILLKILLNNRSAPDIKATSSDPQSQTKEDYLSKNVQDYFPEEELLDFMLKFENFTLESPDLSKQKLIS